MNFASLLLVFIQLNSTQNHIFSSPCLVPFTTIFQSHHYSLTVMNSLLSTFWKWTYNWEVVLFEHQLFNSPELWSRWHTKYKKVQGSTPDRKRLGTTGLSHRVSKCWRQDILLFPKKIEKLTICKLQPFKLQFHGSSTYFTPNSFHLLCDIKVFLEQSMSPYTLTLIY